LKKDENRAMYVGTKSRCGKSLTSTWPQPAERIEDGHFDVIFLELHGNRTSQRKLSHHCVTDEIRLSAAQRLGGLVRVSHKIATKGLYISDGSAIICIRNCR